MPSLPEETARALLRCLPLPLWAGTLAARSKPQFHPARDHWSLYVVVAGDLTVQTGAGPRRHLAPCVYIVPPGEAVRDAGIVSGSRVVMVEIALIVAPGGEATAALLSGLGVVPLRAPRRVEALCARIVRATAASPGGRGLMPLHLRLAERPTADQLLQTVLADATAAGRLADAATPRWLADIARRAQARLKDPAFDVGAMAHLAGCSRVRLTRAFTARFGIAPGAWLRRERVALAARLLAAHPQSGVAEIAARSGFRDRSTFSRVFAALAGRSPRAWRRGGGQRRDASGRASRPA